MPNSNFQSIRLLDLGFWQKLTYLMTNSVDPYQLASSEANWSGSTLFAKTEHVVFSKRRVKSTKLYIHFIYLFHFIFLYFFFIKPSNLLLLDKICFITKTRLYKYIENFTSKNWKFSDKNSDIFHFFAQNIDCGYLLEPPCRGDSNVYPQSMLLAKIRKIMFTPIYPSFTI